MKTLTIENRIARAAAWDAGNRNAKRNGRNAWSEEDFTVAANTFKEIIEVINDNP